MKLHVLYICPHKDLGGASQSMLDMVDSLPEIIEPIILTTEEGELSKECRIRGYQCIIKPFSDLACLRLSLRQFARWPWGPPIIKYIYRDFLCLIFLSRHLKKGDIDLVHSNVSGCTIGIYIARMLKVPHIWHIREAIDLHFNDRICLGRKRLKRMINNADARIAISTAVKKHLEMKDDHSFIIYDAVRKENEITFVPEKDKYFLFVSFCLSEAKGASTAIKAFGLSGLQHKGYRLKMVGHCQDQYKENLLEIAKKSGIENNIDFIPFQKDIRPLFLHATAFIQASVYEGLGRTTAEAMFFGCPVIATAYSGGTLDLIKNNVTGYLFNDVEDCALQMKKVISSNTTDITDHAHDFAKNNLTYTAFGPKLLEAYNSIVK